MMNSSIYRSGLLAAALALTVTGCSWHLSPGAEKGAVEGNKLVYPDANKAWNNSGKIVPQENITSIKIGTTKDELYQLIGAPHFSEGFNAREWDYILRYYDNNRNLKAVRYKVIFADDYAGKLAGGKFRVSEIYWDPISNEEFATFKR